MEKNLKKKVGNKEVDYWWCEALQMWAKHKPEHCKAKKEDAAQQRRRVRIKEQDSDDEVSRPHLQAKQSTVYVLGDESSENEA